MLDSINFLRDRQKKLSKLDVQDRLWFKYALGVFGVCLLAFLISFGASFWFQYQVNQAKADQERLKQSVLSQQSIESSYLLFVHKLKALSQLFAVRSNKQQAIAYFSSVFGSQVLVKQINYQADKGILSFGLRTEDVFVLERVFGQLGSQEIKDRFGEVKRSELKRSSDGQYEVTVTVVLDTSGGAKK